MLSSETSHLYELVRGQFWAFPRSSQAENSWGVSWGWSQYALRGDSASLRWIMLHKAAKTLSFFQTHMIFQEDSMNGVSKFQSLV